MKRSANLICMIVTAVLITSAGCIGGVNITADDGEIAATGYTNVVSATPTPSSYSYPYGGPIMVDSPFDDERIVFYPDGSMYYYDSGEMAWGNYQIIELNSKEIVIWSSFEGEDEITTLSEGGYVWDSNGEVVEGFRWYVE